jgi:hypothetical protein
MSVREQALSLLFAAFLLLKAAEAVFDLESWPASSVSMFSGRRPASVVPHRSRIVATRGDESFELNAFELLLTRDEFGAALFPDPRVASRCQVLVDAWNARQPDPARRIRVARVLVEPIARPGVPTDARTWTVLCRKAAGLEDRAPN